jgi:hypothetical protein
MTSAIKTLFPPLLALAFLAGCKGATGANSQSSAAGAEKTSPTPTDHCERIMSNFFPRAILRVACVPSGIRLGC